MSAFAKSGHSFPLRRTLLRFGQGADPSLADRHRVDRAQLCGARNVRRRLRAATLGVVDQLPNGVCTGKGLGSACTAVSGPASVCVATPCVARANGPLTPGTEVQAEAAATSTTTSIVGFMTVFSLVSELPRRACSLPNTDRLRLLFQTEFWTAPTRRLSRPAERRRARPRRRSAASRVTRPGLCHR